MTVWGLVTGLSLQRPEQIQWRESAGRGETRPSRGNRGIGLMRDTILLGSLHHYFKIKDTEYNCIALQPFLHIALAANPVITFYIPYEMKTPREHVLLMVFEIVITHSSKWATERRKSARILEISVLKRFE